jgi:hypothetical protein
MPKTVLASKFQEWKGLDRISIIVHEMKCIFREITKDDFGIDGEIEIVVPKPDGKGFETTGGIIKVQAKSGMSYVKGDTEDAFFSQVRKEDLELWYNANYPTIYIVYHPDDDKLYWKEIQSFVRNTPNIWHPPFKIVFDKAKDEFTPNCFDMVRSFAPTTDHSRLSFTAKEKLFSNLLKINRMPKIWSADTDKKYDDDVRYAIQGFIPPFTIFSGKLYSLSDLNNSNCALRQFCDVSSVREEPIQQWWDDDVFRRHYVYLLNRLLGIHLRRCGIRYNKKFGRNYFPREDDIQNEFKSDWYNVRTKRHIHGRQTAKYYTYGFNSFWRHTAADLSFRLIGRSWYLQVMPKYFFTIDGIVAWNSEKVGEYTTQVKASENNYHVLNHVLFWADTLSRANPNTAPKSQIVIQLDGKSVLVIEKMPLSVIANFSIPYDPTTYDEEIAEELSQTNMFDMFDPVGVDDDDN